MNVQTMLITSSALSIALACSGAGIASAKPIANDGIRSANAMLCASQEAGMRGVDVQLACKIVEIGQSLSTSEDGRTIRTTLSDRELVEEYGFTKTQVRDFRAILSGTYVQPFDVRGLDSVSTRASSGARFYISNQDLKAGAFAIIATAASTSPEALAAAFVAVSSMIGGPIGSALAAGVSLLGIGFFADLAVKITGALVRGKEVAFYTKWGFPPIVARIE